MFLFFFSIQAYPFVQSMATYNFVIHNLFNVCQNVPISYCFFIFRIIFNRFVARHLYICTFLSERTLCATSFSVTVVIVAIFHLFCDWIWCYFGKFHLISHFTNKQPKPHAHKYIHKN